MSSSSSSGYEALSSGSSCESSPTISSVKRSVENNPLETRSPVKGTWQQVVKRCRKRSQKSPPAVDRPSTPPASPPLPPLNLDSDEDFPRLPVSPSGSSSPIDNPYAQTVKAAVKQR